MFATRDNRGRGRRKSSATAQRDRAEHDVRLAVFRLQDSAYSGLRSALANVAIFFGFVGAFAIAVGAVDGAHLVPTIVGIVAGLAGAAYYPAGKGGRLAGYLLLLATVLVVVGVLGLVLVEVLYR